MKHMRRIIIDTRPLPVILLEKTYRHLIFFSLLVFILTLIMDNYTFPGLSPQGTAAILIFLFTAISWVLNIFPPVIPAITGTILLAVTGTVNREIIFRSFSHPTVLFLLSALLLAGALIESGGGEIIAQAVLKISGNFPRALPVLIYNVSALLSFFMPEHAVAVIFLPVVLNLISNLRLGRGSTYAKLLILSLTWGCITGGVVTLLGGARNPLAVSILHEFTGIELSFSSWIRFSILPSLFIILTGQIVLYLTFRRSFSEVSEKNIVERRTAAPKGYLTWIVFLCVVAFWFSSESTVELAVIGLAGAMALFILKIVNWVEVEDTVNWGIFLMYGGAISIGSALYSTGATEWLVKSALYHLTPSPAIIVAITVILSILLTEGVSNTAVVAVLLPVITPLFQKLNMPETSSVFLVALPSGLPFILPAGAPAIALAYSTGRITVKDTVLPGLVMHIITILTFTVWYHLYWG